MRTLTFYGRICGLIRGLNPKLHNAKQTVHNASSVSYIWNPEILTGARAPPRYRSCCPGFDGSPLLLPEAVRV